MQCAVHPSVETELACGRCGKPICPRCLVMTPVGARCRDCAHLRRLPTYQVGTAFLLRGLVAALAVGAATGALWAFLFSPRAGAFIGLFVGLGLGYAVGESTSWAANRKRSPVLQGMAVVGVLLAYVVRNLVEGGTLFQTNDVFGYVVVAVAVFIAIGRLR
jgi:cation transport ATPase